MEFYNNKGEKIDLVDFNYLNHRSLLVNGDFQINQRGDKEYTTDGRFTLDVWLLKQGLLIKPIANGITVSKRSGASTFMFMQNIPHQMENGKNYTFSIKCGGQIYSKTFVYDNTNQTSSLNAPFVFENSDIGVKVFNFNGKGVIQIYLKLNTLDFEYIDLFEGDIVYPHVKKTYAEDLMECRRYLIVERIYTTTRISIPNLSYNYTVNFATEMANKPNFTSKWSTLTNVDEPSMSADKRSYTLMYIPKKQDVAFAGTVIFSCEPQ